MCHVKDLCLSFVRDGRLIRKNSFHESGKISEDIGGYFILFLEPN